MYTFFIIFIIVVCILVFCLQSSAFLIHKIIFGKRWTPDGIVKYYTLEDYEGLEAKAVSFPGKKGLLRGNIYAYPKKDDLGIVVFAHGMWGSHQAYLQEIEALAAAGYKVLGFDYTGTDLSDGKNICGLGESLKSLVYALTFVKNDPVYSKDKVYVIGHSWGGYASSAIAKYYPNLDGIVTMSAFISVYRQFFLVLPKPFRFLAPFLVVVDFFKCGRYSLDCTKRILKKTKVKTLMVHSKDDPMVLYKKSTGLIKKKIQNNNISYLLVDDRLHNPDYSKEAISYMKECHSAMKTMSKDEVLEFRKNMNYHLLGQLDPEIINSILNFLKSSN